MATIQTIGTIGERLDLLIRQGATFGPFTCTVEDAAGAPVSLAGATVRGQIRKKPGDATVIATLAITSPYDATGVFTFGLDEATTRAISCGVSYELPASLYCWDMELVQGDRVTPLYWGDVRVHREVTRA